MLKRFLILAAAAAVTTAAALPAGIAAAQTERVSANPPSRSDFEAIMMSVDPEQSQAFRREFPREFSEIVDQLVAGAQTMSSEELNRYAAQLGHQTMMRQVSYLPRASTELLLVLADRQAEFFRSLLAERPDLCGEMISGGAQFVPASLPPRAEAASRRMAIAMIEAAGSGSRGAHPPRAPLSERQIRPWAQAMTQLDTNNRIMPLFSNGRGLLSAPAELRCEASMTMFAAIRRMPPETGAHVLAGLMAPEHMRDGD